MYLLQVQLIDEFVVAGIIRYLLGLLAGGRPYYGGEGARGLLAGEFLHVGREQRLWDCIINDKKLRPSAEFLTVIRL